MNKSQSKYFNTAVRMDEAFLALLEQKDFDFITVKEICEQAGVNRSTFYLHYETVGDLLAECTKYISKKCFERFAVTDLTEKISSCSPEELILVTPEFLIPYLEFVQENKVVFRACVTKSSTLNVEETFDGIFKMTIAPILRRFQYQPDEIDYVITFYISGLIAIVMEWVKRDCADDISRIMEIIMKVTVPSGNGILALERANDYLNGKRTDSPSGSEVP